MPLIRNELGELYRAEDFEPPKFMKLKPVNMGQVRVDEAVSALKGEGRPRHRKIGGTDACEWCDGEYTVKTAQQRFCCPECSTAWKKDRRRKARQA